MYGSVRRLVGVVMIAGMLIALAGCAAGPGLGGSGTAGFWQGLWHGLITPVTFWVSLFNSGVSIYEVHNSGHWYDAGFLIGASIVFGSILRGGYQASGSRSRRKTTR